MDLSILSILSRQPRMQNRHRLKIGEMNRELTLLGDKAHTCTVGAQKPFPTTDFKEVCVGLVEARESPVKCCRSFGPIGEMHLCWCKGTVGRRDSPMALSHFHPALLVVTAHRNRNVCVCVDKTFSRPPFEVFQVHCLETRVFLYLTKLLPALPNQTKHSIEKRLRCFGVFMFYFAVTYAILF